MDDASTSRTGPDLAQGVSLDALADGQMLVGHVGDAEVLLAHVGDDWFAIDAACTHYHGPLGDGLLAGDTVRCPWHHACFSLRDGEAVRAPALSPVGCWVTTVRDGRVFVRDRAAPAPRPRLPAGDTPSRIVVVGGGAAGFAAAEQLRRLGYAGQLTMLSDDDAPPVDRPNLSKDYLAGAAPEDWVPLRDDAYYATEGIDLRLRTRVTGLDPASREAVLADGSRVRWDRLLLATGAEALRPPIPGIDLPHVHTLRTLADCRAIIAGAANAARAVVVGASFIGLEVAASLRARGLEVQVVAPEARPMERVLGAAIGDFVRALHEAHGVVFRLGATVRTIDAQGVVLDDGSRLDAALVVVGVGVRPRVALAERAGIATDRGVAVDAFLSTSAPGVWAAGDIARWPDAGSGASIRVEHWVVAQRQGQAAAVNMLGGLARFDAVPFFWSQHYDASIAYVGHAAQWDDVAIDGDIAARDCAVRFRRDGRVLAIATIGRDVESLRAELAMEREATARAG